MKNKDNNLDNEEQELLDSFENGEWEVAEDSEEIKKVLFQASENMMKKNKKITLRVTDYDLTKLKSRSLETGIPYQTILNALIHQYVQGDISIRL